MLGASECSVCRKQVECRWVCLVCDRASIRVTLCSERCKRVHLRDGRHRRELKAQRR